MPITILARVKILLAHNFGYFRHAHIWAQKLKCRPIWPKFAHPKTVRAKASKRASFLRLTIAGRGNQMKSINFILRPRRCLKATESPRGTELHRSLPVVDLLNWTDLCDPRGNRSSDVWIARPTRYHCATRGSK